MTKTAGSGATPKCHGSATLSTTLINTTIVCTKARVSDPDPHPEPHQFELLNLDPHSNCGSGSRNVKMPLKKQVKCEKMPHKNRNN
jgi:hypothetical protein